MKDLKNGGQSKGYAFIAFETHESALNALRKLVSGHSLMLRKVDFGDKRFCSALSYNAYSHWWPK